MNQSNNKGKVYVVGVVVFTVLFVAGILELPYGTIQKAIFKYKVKHYLEQTYNEKMVVKKVIYLWDNIEPIRAVVAPKNAEHLEFFVYPSVDQTNAYYDNYPETYWLHQAKDDVERLLAHTNSDMRPDFSIAIACCMEADRVRVSNGVVPAYTDANLMFDMSFQLNMQPDILEHLVTIIAGLQQYEWLNIGSVSFVLQPEPNDSFTKPIEYKVAGNHLQDIHSIEDLEAYRSKF